MERSEIETIINGLDSLHPLKSGKSLPYKDVLIEKLESVPNLDAAKLKTLLCGNEKYSKDKYNQGLSEILLYILFSQKGLPFQFELKQNATNNCDVDVVLQHKGITYNFEVKSPQYNEHADGVICGGFAFRFGDKEANDLQLTELENQLKPNIGKAGYTEIKRNEITDNKVKDCLLSAQEKFAEPSETNCNILFICTTTGEMIRYWQYIVNECSGFFHPFSDVSSFLDSDRKSISKQNYNKVNAIILSNAITLNERRENDSWDVGKAINIVLMNPAAKSHCLYGLQILSEFFPDNTCEFIKALFEGKQKNSDIPELCYAYTFVSKNGFDLNKEKERKGE